MKTAMIKKQLKHFDLLEAKRAYKEGKNITELLRSQKNIDSNTSEIIETAYDLQAGSYIENMLNNNTQAQAYTTELASILDNHITKTNSLLDIGTGELTTLSHLIYKLTKKPKKVFAFDISWSRIHKGKNYAKEVMGADYRLLKLFVADINEIPLRDKSINITTSSHALEPNGGTLKELLSELFRITIDKLVLFEPCFEINTQEGKQRMERLGYIQNIDGVVEELGGKMIEKIVIKNTINPLNPTVCFVITPPLLVTEIPFPKDKVKQSVFSVPGTDIPLIKVEDYFFSNQVGLCYPTLKAIPILKSNTAILASSLCV
jgi:ubiquinone/menaquinone biosynthesis C-methylase UbiE